MLSIQSSSYGVSALVSSQMPAATKNGEANPSPAKTSGSEKVEGSRPAGGPPPGGPPPGGPPPAAPGAETSTDDATTALSLLETYGSEEPDETGQTTTEDFEAAARFLLDSIDLREEDDVGDVGTNDSGISFDEAGTYRPAWIK